jgi:hypothetical protein
MDRARLDPGGERGAVLRRQCDAESQGAMKRLVAVLLPVAGFALAPVAIADEPGASRIVDRTFVCATEGTGDGRRDLDLDSHPHTVYPGNEVIAAFLGVSSGTDTLTSELVAVRAAQRTGLGGVVRPAGVYVQATSCRASRVGVPLTARGLAGPPVPWTKFAECVVDGRVLVHVRATLTAPADWQQSGAYVGARRGVVDAKVAVRAAGTRKPIAYMELAGARKTRLWYADACA